MKKSTKLVLLFLATSFLAVNAIQAQSIQYSQNQIVGTWILKSASFNGAEVPMADCKDQVSFEFSKEGRVKYKTFEGKTEEGVFIISENKIIDPETPEHPNADILKLTDKGLVLEMKEEEDKVLMTFEISGLD